MLGQINQYARLILTHYSTVYKKINCKRLPISIKPFNYKPITKYMLDLVMQSIYYAINT